MGRYIARRLILTVVVLLLVSLFVFSLVHILPGDVVVLMLKDVGRVGTEQLEVVRAQLGLDKPFFTQYFIWLWGLLRGDLGKSIWTVTPVSTHLKEALPTTVEIIVLSLVVSTTIGVLAGAVSAVRRYSWMDYVATVFSLTGLSVPSFWMATIILFVLSVYFHWMPPLFWVSPFVHPIENLKSFFWPSAVLGFVTAAQVARITRTSLLDVIREDYIRTAWAKGLRERVVIARHALKNALIPVVTVMGVIIARLLGGTVIVEVVFAQPGLGRLTLNAVTLRDYTVVQGCLMFMATVVIVINLLIDISYAWLDPRIRYT